MIWITRRHVMAGPSGLGLPMSSRKSIGVYTPIDSKVVRFSISSSWLMVSVFHKIVIPSLADLDCIMADGVLASWSWLAAGFTETKALLVWTHAWSIKCR
jgi:hypothetical protein